LSQARKKSDQWQDFSRKLRVFRYNKAIRPTEDVGSGPFPDLRHFLIESEQFGFLRAGLSSSRVNH
jgi:hypothetical protein